MTINQIFTSIDRKEWLVVIIVALSIIVISSAPLIYGWINTPPDKVFTGTRFLTPYDWFVYYSYIEQVKQGNFLFHDLFTSESSLPFFNILWLAVGLLAKILSLNSWVAFNLARILLIPFFYFVAYLFVAYLFVNKFLRKLMLVLLSFGSGLGIFLSGHFITYPHNFSNFRPFWPLDLWMPETVTFLTLYSSPHFIASLTLMLLVFFFTLLAVENRNLVYSCLAGISALVLFSFHPFHVATIFLVVFFYFILLLLKRYRHWRHLIYYYLVLIIFSLPAIFYYFYLINFDSVTRQKALQNITPTTPLGITILSYGLIFIFALTGVYFILKKKEILNDKYLFIILWAVSSLVIIYLPFNYQRRLIQGLHFPLAALATIGLFYVYQFIKLKKNFFYRQSILFAILGGALVVGSNFFNVAADFYIYQHHYNIAYISESEWQAVNWFKNTPTEAVVINLANNGINYIPAYAGRRVYVGHGVETPFYFKKKIQSQWFYSQNHERQQETSFLESNKINYVYYGPVEKQQGSFNPAEKDYLKKVFGNSEVVIYQVL